MTDNLMHLLRVLIAEDSTAVRDRLRAHVSQLPGVAVIETARDGQEALDHSRTLRPDLLILDLHMPRMSGLCVLKKLRQEDNRAIVVVITDQMESEYRDRVLAAGADYFLPKSNHISELEEILQNEVSRYTKRPLLQ